MEEGHEELIKRHNSLVKEGDEVFHLGDFCWSASHAKEILERLNGKHKLIMGNHDPCHPMHKKAEKFKRLYQEWGFEMVACQVTTEIGKYSVLMNHFPYWDDNAEGYEQRYKDWRPPIDNPFQILLRGHSHSKPHEVVKCQNGRLMIDVGVDGHVYIPWHEDELLELIEKNI
jgi:calcineurin-like phosphoesterase family protein